jgi:hypothetical protein
MPELEINYLLFTVYCLIAQVRKMVRFSLGEVFKIIFLYCRKKMVGIVRIPSHSKYG